MLIDHKPIFGKNVIETLSEGMYDNPLFLFREYVQNSADAIDAAVRAGLLQKDEGQIVVTIDYSQRIITFEDNGIGIPKEQVNEMLANVGASHKDRITDKGFRGIGRLGGLGYCQKVRFETSSKGESVTSIFEWDARNLHEILVDRNERIDASELIKRITSTWSKQCDKDKHFFKMSLININPQSDELLDVEEVRKYLAMVAPVPFSYERFRFVEDIESFLKENQIELPDEYRICLNGDEINKGYETPLKIEGKKDIEIHDVYCKTLTDPNGRLLGWYWFCVSAFDGFLPKKCWQRGLRLRKANIQIGDADCLTNHPKRGLALWKDDRGNSYFIGEIHALDEDLIPNSRRDYFNQDVACRRFEKALSNEFSDCWDLCRIASDIRSATRHVRAAEVASDEFSKKDKDGLFYDKSERDSEAKKLEIAREKAVKAERTIQKIKEKVADQDEESGQPSPLTTIVEIYATDENKKSISEKPLTIDKSPKKGFAKAKLNRGERRIIEIVQKVLSENLSPSEADAIHSEVMKRVAGK